MTDMYEAGVEEATHQIRSELKSSRAANRKLSERVGELESALAKYTVADPHSLTLPPWQATKKSRSRKHVATPILMLSDLHLDEVVNPLELNGANAFSRAIAEVRFARVIEATIAMSDVGGVEMDGIVAALLGDMVTGVIHDELARTNEAPVMDTVVHWVPIIASGLTRLADHFGKVLAPCVDGNHDRFFTKMSAKQRAQSSVAWVFYGFLAKLLEADTRITFKITPASEQVIQVQNTRFLLTHGDGFKSAGGIGGIYPSMLKFLHRKHQQFAVIDLGWDVALMGHWHQTLLGPDFAVNGSLKGYDEYAASHGFGMEPPAQTLLIVTPEHGISHHIPIYAEDTP